VVFSIERKSDVIHCFKIFKARVENETGNNLKVFRFDRGGEFISRDFNTLCADNGIIRHLTTPYTPQQNGVVERRNRTLLEMTRSMLKAKQVPNCFWGEAVQHAIYITNRIPTRALKEVTPYEFYYQRKPNLEHLRVFGSLAYTKVNDSHLRKLNDRSKKTVYFGTESGSKGYRLFDPQNQKIIVSRDVIVDEDSSWSWDIEVKSKPVCFGYIGPISLIQEKDQ